MTCDERLECVYTNMQVGAMMNSDRIPDDKTSDSSRTPLVPIGLAMVAVLIVPIMLYSVGPEGPLKAGDVVFSTDRHRVTFLDPTTSRMQGFQDFCILESRVQLVAQKIDVMPEIPIVAQPIGVETVDVPYCPPRTSIIVHPYQATLKADVWGGLRDAFSNLVSGR